MRDLESVRRLLAGYAALKGARAFFEGLGYPTIDPLPEDLEKIPQGAREAISSVHRIVHLKDGFPFRIFHVELRGGLRRTDIRRFLESYYRHNPTGENLFVFAPSGSADELAFVSPLRLLDPRDPHKVRLWLRILQVRREAPYRTDLEVLSRIRADGVRDPSEIWRRHQDAFSVQRVTEEFFRDYQEIFAEIQNRLARTHRGNGRLWARDYAHQLLNRIMFLYFIARKGWLQGPDGEPDRDFMRHFWEAYRGTGARDAFHRDWLDVLFFEAFNNRWQNRAEYQSRFPEWLRRSLSQAPFLNGGLYTRRPGLDDRLERWLPDEIFALLFEKWTDGAPPGFFERYNFTVVESGRFDEEVAVDPEMLGTVYERLVNVTFEGEGEDLRGAAGIFYTPRTEIDLMCRLALVDWLGNRLPTGAKSLLYQWVFAFSEEEKQEADEAITRQDLWNSLDELVRRVRVCDPACGSGSFLVGMLLVLDDLQARCDRTLGRADTPYERRKRILQDQLYGVDVMEWAVRVAELRLWLQLVVETELRWWEVKARPLLPNLNLKIRHGDSLLQTLGDLDLSPFRRGELSIPAHLKGRLTQLLGRKRRFFQGEAPGLTEEMLRKEERDLFRDILAHRIHELENRIKADRERLRSAQAHRTLPGMTARPPEEAERQRQELEEELRKREEELERLREARKALAPDRPPPFVWDMAFVEIFEDENPGFDIVIGNPPYVRQEKIRDYMERFDREEYLRRLNESLRAIYPAFLGKSRRISGRADYYVYFYLHALSLLADGGAFCFITSNSWLDVDFGKDLQEFFLRFGHLRMVIDNRAKRSFAQADVNTVIVLAGPPERRRPLTEEEMKRRPVRFVAFRVPFEEAISPVVFSEIEDERLYQPLAGFRVLRRPEFRAILTDQWSLYQEGLAEPEEDEAAPSGGKARRRGKGAPALGGMALRPYAGAKWGGKYLRAPDIFFTILEKGKDQLVRLGDIAEVRFGIKTGANEFFYLEPVGRTVKEAAALREKAPRAPVRVRNGAGWEGEIEAAWLRPVIKSPREIRTLRVRLEDLRYLVFMPPEDIRKAIDQGRQPPLSRYPKAAAYIRWGERQGYPTRPTCASRAWWWDLGKREPANFIWPMIHNDRAIVGVHDHRIQVDHNLFEIAGEGQVLLAAVMVSSQQVIIRELFGRSSLGEGALKTEGVDIVRLLTIHPPTIDQPQAWALLNAFNHLSQRPIRSIFEELGFPLCRERKCGHPEHPYEHVRPEALTLEQVRAASPDRFELDRVVFDALGLTDEERVEVYRAVAQLVKDRLVKARSV
ncbi:MAG: Eco57I restriction-modification methylase domain-containing protein [Thermoflexus hugenholtzii]|uniref:Eco57I restriction-modification methylase domain-containing protein n=1 Tax=Thermoflexus TaxID=1495649 RepID=UPI001C76FC5A|nr:MULTISPECIES: DNA methyltransferase [Thermoflexus]QWK10142.1 MAG: Eco57I restriction-modification methylase domain-containing protein [Thermoflexus hugenholtzii]